MRTRCSVHLHLEGEPEGEPRYAIDLSPDAAGHFLREGVVMDRLEHLLITHAHADHLDPDLLRVRGTILSDRSAPPDLHVYGSVTVGELLPGSMRERARIHFHEIAPGGRFSAGALAVTAVRAHHGQPGLALHYIVEHGGKTALLAWDTGWWSDETWAAMEGRRFDLVISECTALGPGEPNREGSHLNFATLLQMKQRLTEMSCISGDTPWATLHIGDNGGLTYDEQVELATPHGVTVGWDGLRLDV